MSALSYTVRSLLKNLPFTFVAVLTLAVGIGASSAVFAVVHAVLLRSLPFGDPDRIVALWEKTTATGEDRFPVAPANFLDWRAQNEVFDHVAAFDTDAMGLSGRGTPRRVSLALVSADFFPILGIRPARGRSFLPSDDRPDSPPVAVLSHRLAARLYGASPAAALGQLLRLDDQPYQVIGIMPPSLRYPDDVEMWIPLKLGSDAAAMRDLHYLRVVAVLKPGIRLERARRDMDLIAARLERENPKTNQGRAVNVLPLREQLLGDIQPALLALFGAVGLVLLLAGVNVSTLVLARAIGRRREIAVRLALGASGGQLASQLLAEGAVVALCGGALGLGIAVLGIRLITRFGPASIPRLDEVGFDGTLLGFTLLITLVTAPLVELVPLLFARRLARRGALGEGRSERPRRRSRESIVALEICLALVLLIATGLVIRSFDRLLHVPTGFRPAGLVTLQTVLPDSRYSKPAQQIAFYRSVLARLAALPGVRETAVATSIPFAPGSLTLRFSIEGRPLPPSGEKPSAGYDAVSPGYFRTLGIPLLAGRDFTLGDAPEAPGVAIISQAMAKKFWPREAPLGKYVKIGRDERLPRQIVGIVGDVQHSDLGAPAEARIYVPFVQHPWALLTLLVRARPGVVDVAGGLRAAVWAVDKEQAVASVQTMDEILAEQVARPRFTMLLMSAFAAIALLLAAIGVYGVNSYLVACRIGEVGIRMALGAGRRDVLKLLLRDALRPVTLGAAGGLLLALGLARILASLLFQVSATDLPTYLGSAVVLILVAIAAICLPVRRAVRVDPILALRSE